MTTVKINAEIKSASGKKAAKATRAAGLIPAIIYGGKEQTQIAVKHKDIKPAIFTNNFTVVEVTVDGTTHKCFVKDAQFHPVTEEIIHIDFLRLVDGVPVRINLPIIFDGTAKGVKDGGAFLPQVLKVKVKALPKNVVPSLTVDISDMGMGDVVKIGDLQGVEGIEIMEEPSTPIAKVIVPRSLKSVMGEEGEEGDDEAVTGGDAAPAAGAPAE